jgi:hypothetical protein
MVARTGLSVTLHTAQYIAVLSVPYYVNLFPQRVISRYFCTQISYCNFKILNSSRDASPVTGVNNRKAALWLSP